MIFRFTRSGNTARTVRATEQDLPRHPVVGLSQHQVTVHFRVLGGLSQTQSGHCHIISSNIQPEILSSQALREAGEHQQSLVGQAGLSHLTWINIASSQS